MDRRRVLQAASIGVGSGLAGCLGWFDGADGDDDATENASPTPVDCDLTPLEQVTRVWPHEKANPTRSRHVEKAALAVDEPLEQRPLQTVDEPLNPVAASLELLCCEYLESDSLSIIYVFIDRETGEERWRIRDQYGESESPLEPPDGTAAYDSAHIGLYGIVDGLVYVGATYYDSAPVTAGLFALDATDGTVEWSRAGLYFGELSVDRSGRLYDTGVSDALLRTEPSDRHQNAEGEWTPESGIDWQLHARALNARTGETCWEWTRDPSEAVATDAFRPHGIADGQVLLSVPYEETWGEADHRAFTLYRLDEGSGTELEPIQFRGPPRWSTAGVAGRLVLITQGPPVVDAPADEETISALDLDSGEVDWSVPLPGDRLESGSDDALVLSGDGLVGVDPTTGETLWEIGTDEEVACIADETLVTYDPGRPEVLTRSLDSGDVIARTPVEGTEITSDVIVAGGQLFLRVSDGSDDRLVTLR